MRKPISYLYLLIAPNLPGRKWQTADQCCYIMSMAQVRLVQWCGWCCVSGVCHLLPGNQLASQHYNYYVSIGVLFTGKGKTVVVEDCQPIMQCSGLPRMGRGFAESTFRKNYHALRSISREKMNTRYLFLLLIPGRMTWYYYYVQYDPLTL